MVYLLATMARLAVTALVFMTIAGVCGYRFPCYFTNWAQYRHGAGKFLPENIPGDLCTHGMYAFAKLSNNKVLPFEWNDQKSGGKISKGLYARFNAIKKKHPGFKTVLSVGGWNAGTSQFSHTVSTRDNRKQFINNTIVYLRKWNFDGIDIDWEYPAARGSPPQDRHLFTVLLQEMHGSFESEARAKNRPRLLLTAAINGGLSARKYYELDQIGKYLDFVNIMTYDYHGAFDHNHKVGFNSPLNPDMIKAVYNITREGLPKDKINLGISSYGRSFTLTHQDQYIPGSPFTSGGTPGEYTRSSGLLSYYEICSHIKYDGWKSVWNNTNLVPYAFKGNQWVGYDNVKSATVKVDFLRVLKLGGAFMWNYDMDDFTNMCKEGAYPIAKAVKKALVWRGGRHGGRNTHSEDRQKFRLQNDEEEKNVVEMKVGRESP